MNRLPEMDFYLHQATYGQRLPPNLGGINGHLASMAANKKIFCVDWDHPTFMQTPAVAHSIGAGVSHTSKFQGWAKDIATLRTMWRRDISHLWATGAGVLWDHVFGQPYAYDDPSIIAEMKFLVDTAKVFKPATVSSPVAEVALIYDEKNVDYLRQGLQTMNYTWARAQQDELLASGVPYAAWLMDDLRRGKIPTYKLYIFQNALDLNPENAAAIEKLKKGGATLIFLRDTGWAQSGSSPETLGRVMGMTMALQEKAGRSKHGWQSGHALVQWRESSIQADPLLWPETWQCFGPVEKSDAPPSEKELASLQTQLSLGGKTLSAKKIQAPGGYVNLADTLGLKAREGMGAWLFTEITSDSDRTVEMGAGADWWMEWFVNGKKVYDTLGAGNGSGSFDIRNHRFKIPLKKGANVLAVRVLSGSAGFVLTSGGPNELTGGRSFEPGREGIKVEPQYTLVPIDPKAVLLAPYPGTELAGYAVREHDHWKSIFVGNRLLSRFMISALARYAVAWRITTPETVVQAGQNFLMLHPLESGIKNISWKREAVFTPWGSEGSPLKGKDIKLDLKAGETYLFKVE